MSRLIAKLAVDGGIPVRPHMLPYGRQLVDESDIQAVVEVLRSDWLTTGPVVTEFEDEFTKLTGANEAVALSNGTAALHAAIYSIGVDVADEIIVPAITFVATANCIVYQGGIPVFADVHPDTLLLDPIRVEEKITTRTKAIIAMDYAGHPCDYDALRVIADRHGLILIADACHSLGGSFRGSIVGSLAALNVFSFHPVKAITTGEGGMVTTDNKDLAARMRMFRNHGITSDHRQRELQGSFQYEMVDLGYNYRITDIQCVLGLSQLKKLPDFVSRRGAIAAQYDASLANSAAARTLFVHEDVLHAYHLYIVKLHLEQLNVSRMEVFEALRAENIGVNVHYMPLYMHPYHRQFIGDDASEICPVAEEAFECILSLPIFPSMTDGDVAHVIEALDKVLNWYAA